MICPSVHGIGPLVSRLVASPPNWLCFAQESQICATKLDVTGGQAWRSLERRYLPLTEPMVSGPRHNFAKFRQWLVDV